MRRTAVAQIAMRWSTRENVDAILRTMELAHAQGAEICAFSELAVTSFHREIRREAVRGTVQPARPGAGRAAHVHAEHLAADRHPRPVRQEPGRMNDKTARTAALAAALSLAVSACSTLDGPRCAAAEQPAVQDSLYFGTGRAGGAVTADEWSRFLEQEVTPRFPRGLTVSQAAGQWRGADGSIVREATYVLHLLHANDAQSELSVASIVSAYKAQFRQEAVLRVRAKACMSF